MGYYNYPIAHSYISRAYAFQTVGDLLGGPDTIHKAVNDILGDTTAQQQIKNLSSEASTSATGAALDVVKQQFAGGLESIKPYLPFIAIGGVAIVALLFLI